MNMLTVDEILAAGFKFIPTEFIKVSGQGREPLVIDRRFMVHQSVKINRTCVFLTHFNSLDIPDKPPYIEYYTPAAEWRAYAGAITFHLTSEVQLWRFMKAFNYPLPIDQ